MTEPNIIEVPQLGDFRATINLLARRKSWLDSAVTAKDNPISVRAISHAESQAMTRMINYLQAAHDSLEHEMQASFGRMEIQEEPEGETK